MLDESESIDGWRIEAWTKNGYNHNIKEKTNRSHQHKIGRVFDQFRFVAPGVRSLRNALDREDKAIRSIVHLASHIRTRFSRFDRPHKASTVHKNRFVQRVGEDCERRENDRVHAINRLGIDSNRIEAVIRSRRSIVHWNQNHFVPNDLKERLRLQRHQQAARPRRRICRRTQRQCHVALSLHSLRFGFFQIVRRRRCERNRVEVASVDRNREVSRGMRSHQTELRVQNAALRSRH